MAPAITEIIPQAGKKNRLSLVVDGELWVSLSRATLRSLRLILGEVEDLNELRENILRREKAEGFERLSKFLGLRPRSTQEVRSRLLRYGYHPSVADSIVRELVEKGLIEDFDFARWWVREGILAGKGSARLKQELLARGAAVEAVNEALKNEYEEEKDFSRAFQLARHKLARLKEKERKVAQTRIIGFLQRRGFSYKTAIEVWKLLEKEPAGISDEGLDL
jgi:regulatory protein